MLQSRIRAEKRDAARISLFRVKCYPCRLNGYVHDQILLRQYRRMADSVNFR